MIAKANIELSVECVHCNEMYSIYVNPDDLDEWMEGHKLIQDAFPYLSAGERELLISQTCDNCWDRLFKWDSE